MKRFFISLIIGLALIFILNLIQDPFGLLNPSLKQLVDANKDHCVIDMSLIPEGAQKKLKLLVLIHELQNHQLIKRLKIVSF